MNEYQERCKIVIIYPDGREMELLGAEKEAYWEQFMKRYKNHPVASGLSIQPVTYTGIWNKIDHTFYYEPPREAAQCDYCRIFQVSITGYCSQCGAPLSETLT